MANYLDAVHVHEYPDPEQEGKTKSRWTKVGIFFPSKTGGPGGTLIINQGVSVTGKVVIMEPKERGGP